MKNQKKTPYVDALKSYIKEGVTPFDVPGHHMGGINTEFKKVIGDNAYKCDVNAPRGLDNLNHPTGVLKEAEELMADACKADEAFFLINGTSSGIIAMLLATLNAKDKIILPRNCHKSVINGLVLSGGMPIFITPKFDYELEIANQPSLDDYKKAIIDNPNAKAIFVINPTYFGAVLDLKDLTDFAHEHNMLVLVDEAHGAHFGFNYYGPYSAMECNADLSAVSFHKTGGSFTQSSALLRKGDRVSHYEISKALSIINTTSPSTLLLASLDSARKFLATKGQETLNEIINLANYARKEINRIPGFKACGREHFMANGVYDYDDTKLVIVLDNINVSGFEIYKMLKDYYHIQMELAETYVVLGIIAVGSKKDQIDKLIQALKEISSIYYKEGIVYPKYHYDINYPKGLLRPRSAFHAPLKRIKLDEALNEISKEMIMIYPPGIPLIIPGEVFTKEVIDRIKYYRKTSATVLSDYDDDTVGVVDLVNWESLPKYEKEINDYYASNK